MREAIGDLWKLPCHIRCITTNGYVKPNGCAVMGRGCALEAKGKIPKIDSTLGTCIKKFGNHVYPLALMDGMIGMQGRGPINGYPINLDVLLASRDPVALDATAMRLIGPST